MQRDFGRAPSGVRVFGVVPQKHYHTSTLMGALGLDGRLETFIYDGGTDVAKTVTFTENILGPVLKPGDIVVWDNLKPHDSASVIQAIEQRGAKAWSLPPLFTRSQPNRELVVKNQVNPSRSCSENYRDIAKWTCDGYGSNYYFLYPRLV